MATYDICINETQRMEILRALKLLLDKGTFSDRDLYEEVLLLSEMFDPENPDPLQPSTDGVCNGLAF